MSKARERLLETAGQLFAERGYERVGINEIIAKAGIAKATFYQHFPSKEALCAEWLRVEAEHFESLLGELLDGDQSTRAKIAHRFEGLEVYVNQACFNGCPFCVTASMVAPESPVIEVIRSFRASLRAFWQSLALELGLKPAAARDLGDTWMLLDSGSLTEAQNLGEDWPVKQAKKAALRLLDEARG